MWSKKNTHPSRRTTNGGIGHATANSIRVMKLWGFFVYTISFQSISTHKLQWPAENPVYAKIQKWPPISPPSILNRVCVRKIIGRIMPSFAQKFIWSVNSCGNQFFFNNFYFYVNFELWKNAIFPLICSEKCVYTKSFKWILPNLAYKLVWVVGILCHNRYLKHRNRFLRRFWISMTWHISSKLL